MLKEKKNFYYSKYTIIFLLVILLMMSIFQLFPFAIETTNAQDNIYSQFQKQVQNLLIEELDMGGKVYNIEFKQTDVRETVAFALLELTLETEWGVDKSEFRFYAILDNQQIVTVFREPSEPFFLYAQLIPEDLLPKSRLQQWLVIREEERIQAKVTVPGALYKLPFDGGTQKTISRGGINHDNNNSYDFLMPENTIARAARGGEIHRVIENIKDNCSPGSNCPTNTVRIEHADGTFGWYLHLLYNGVIVEEKDNENNVIFVHQGDCLAYTSNTGDASDYHLHFNESSDVANKNRNLVTWVEADSSNPNLNGTQFKSPFSQNRTGSCFYSSYKYVYQSVPNGDVNSGETMRMWFKVRNTGDEPWLPNEVKLGTYDLSTQTSPSSPFWQVGAYGWSANNRIDLRSDQGPINPGQEAIFEADVTFPGPNDPNYQEFRLIGPGETWLSGERLSFQVNVQCSGTGTEFCDVPQSNPFYESIEFVGKARIVNGYSGCLYRPGQPITRGEAALMLKNWWERLNKTVNLAEEGQFTDWDGMPDIPDDPNVSQAVKEAAEYLKKRGVLGGYSDGSFRADDPLTRGAAMKIIVNSITRTKQINLPSLASLRGDYSFTDLNPGDTFERAILTGAFMGLTHGFSDGSFQAGKEVTRAEMAKFLANALYYHRQTTAIKKGETPNYTPLLSSQEKNNAVCSATQKEASPVTPANSTMPLCLSAAKGANLGGTIVTADNTSYCYEAQTNTYHRLEDVPPDYWAHSDIEAMFEAGITTGCNGPYNYCPEDELKRDHLAGFLLRARHYYLTGEPGTDYTPPQATQAIFPDVPLTHPWADWIYELHRLGVINGYSDGLYHPELSVTREAMAIVLLRTLYGSDILSQLPHPLGIFEDVPVRGVAPAWLQVVAGYEEMYWRGFTNGCRRDGLYYCPDDVVLRSHAAAFINRAFLEPVPPTERLGDLCFSTSSGYTIPPTESPGLYDVDDGDIVCYHKAVNRFKMYFNASTNQVGTIDIDALTIPNDGEILFSTRSSRTLPDIGDVEDEDVIRYQNGTYSVVIRGDDFTGLGSEDIDALHQVSGSKLYLSTSGSADYGFDAKDEDVVRLNPGTGSFNPFFDGSAVGVSDDIDAVAIVNDDPNNTSFYFSLGSSACIPTTTGELCAADGDVLQFTGTTGGSTTGNLTMASCFQAQDYAGLQTEGINALYVANDFGCGPSVSLPEPPYLPPAPPPPPSYSLQVYPTTLQFQAYQGGDNPAAQTLSISNEGTEALSWSATENEPWLALSTTSGTAPSIVEVTVNIVGLSPGIYTDTVLINAPLAPESPWPVPVELIIEPPIASVPMLLQAESGHSTIQLNWNPTNDPAVTSYHISRAISGTQTFTQVATVDETVYFDQGNLSETTYCYQVEAIRANGEVATTSNVACAPYYQLSLWIPDVWAAPGQTAIIPINIRNAEQLQIAASDIWLEFDGTVLQPTVITHTPLTQEYTWGYAIHNTGTVSRAQISSYYWEGNQQAPLLRGDGSLFWFTVEVTGTLGYTTPMNLKEFITGVGGSTIYAPDDLFNFVPLALGDGLFEIGQNYVLGDVNGNGVVQAADALLAQLIVAGVLEPTPQQIQAGDVNGNGEIDAADVTMIRHYAIHGTWPSNQTSPALLRQTNKAPAIIEVGEATGLPGETVTVTIKATNLNEWAGGTLAIAYETEVIAEVVEVIESDLVDSFDLTFYDDGAGLFYVTLSDAQATNTTGLLATLVLRLSPAAKAGMVTPLTLAEVKLNDLSGLDMATSLIQQPIERYHGQVSIESQPVLRVSPSQLTFTMNQGGDNPQVQSVLVENVGTGTLTWTAYITTVFGTGSLGGTLLGPNVLQVSTNTGTTPTIVDLSIEGNDLVAGIYTGMIIFESQVADNSPQVVEVVLTVNEVYPLYLPLILR